VSPPVQDMLRDVLMRAINELSTARGQSDMAR
jgi:hypothetical protein